MPVRPLNREEIFQRFPWLQDRERLMVISTDMDGLLSAAFLHHHLDWRVTGYYDCSTLWISEHAEEQRGRLIWVDLDVCRSGYSAIGHHILTLDTAVPDGLGNICNPNLLAGIGAHDFTHKYPFSTILLLLWLHEINVRRDLMARLLILQADSAWINVQHFNRNTIQWQQRLPAYDWKWLFKQVDTEQFERRMRDQLHARLERLTGAPPTDGNPSQHLQLQGSQLRFNPDWEEDIALGLWELAGTYLKWSPPAAPIIHRRIEGRHYTTTLESVTPETFPNDLLEEGVFSYAVTSSKRVNFTRLDW
ncbi:MAG: hypothetical protein JSW54_05680 [Fidelibacterota bacterium]|nr:MAG: hypothetical protein JSW54_05680 [Candidatus Neomarinimicrobiota bacterium]